MLKRRPYKETSDTLTFDSRYSLENYTLFDNFYNQSLKKKLYIWSKHTELGISFIVTLYGDFISEYTVIAEYFFIVEDEFNCDHDFKDRIIFEVDLARVRGDFRNNKISTEFYQLLLNKGILLVSGYSQTIGARKLWTSLSTKNNYLIIDYDNEQEVTEVTIKNIELKNYNQSNIWNRKEERRILLYKHIY